MSKETKNSKRFQKLSNLAMCLEQLPHIRKGQALMTALYYLEEDFYQKITGGEYDCFYENSKIDAFWKKFEDHFGK